MSILPDVANGAVVVRNFARVCQNQTEAANAYCPPNTFLSTCEITALAEDCTARIAPSQINAIVSELLCLAVYLDPNGPWDCDSNCNLRNMFQTWYQSKVTSVFTDGVTITGDGTEDDPITLSPVGAVAAICGNDEAADALAACLISASPGNRLSEGADGRLFVAVTTVITEEPITGNGTAENPIGLDIPALVSADGFNLISVGSDGKLIATVAVAGALSGNGTAADPIVFNGPSGSTIVTEICSTGAREDLADCLISTDLFNSIVVGSDGGLYAVAQVQPPAYGDDETITVTSPLTVIPGGVVSAICEDAQASEALASCLISTDMDNSVVLGSDGKLYVDPAAQGITDGTNILYEIAFPRVTEFAADEILSGYVTATGFTIPEDFLGSTAFVRNPSNDLIIYLYKNNVGVAQILYSTATLTWTWVLAADLVFAVGDLLEFRAANAATFDLLAVTLLVRRPIIVA